MHVTVLPHVNKNFTASLDPNWKTMQGTCVTMFGGQSRYDIANMDADSGGM